MASSPGKKIREARRAAESDLGKAAAKLREAAALISDARGKTSILSETYEHNIHLLEADWVNLANAASGVEISRDSVKDALKKIS
jgi:hypothetical protein